MRYLEYMESVEDLVVELKALTPDQLDQVARIVRALSGGRHGAADSEDPAVASPVPQAVVQQAIRNGWPASLFTDVIGKIGEDFKRPTELPYDVRRGL